MEKERVDWSMLPSDLLGEIVLKLDSIDDAIHFSAVCHSWNDASFMIKRKQYTVPWLLLAENTTENPNYLRKIYNISNNKCYQLSMLETFGARCWGSSYGWVVILTTDFEVQLFNPLTKDRITTLPSLLKFPIEPFDPLSDDDPDWHWRCYVERIMVFKMPQSNDLLIAAVYGGGDYLVFARPGDQSWTLIAGNVVDILFLGNFIYTVSFCGKLRFCDITGNGDLKDMEVMNYFLTIRKGTLKDGALDGLDKVYLLKAGDDLLMVVRHKTANDDGFCIAEYFTDAFEVYRADFKNKKWVEIDNIGNFSLFVGHDTSMSIRASKANNLKPNHIYFTDDERMFWLQMPGFGGHEFGVYDMETRDVIQIYQGDDTHSAFCGPIFFVPNV